MSASPAFQFYPEDFTGGTSDFTQQELGAYILLLCHQWNHGSAPVEPERQQIVARGPVSDHVLAKFKLCPDGVLRNERMELERKKQAHYREQQRLKGISSGVARSKQREPRFNHGSTTAEPSGEPDTQPEGNSPSPSSLAYRERPSEKEVLSYAIQIGLAEWKAKDWFQEMEACGWLDHASRIVVKWRALLCRVRTKWEADGRPSGPPSANKNGKGSSAEPLWRRIHILEEEISKHPANTHSTFHDPKATELQKSSLREMRKVLEDLKQQDAMKVVHDSK